jgi:hypothetical protein
MNPPVLCWSGLEHNEKVRWQQSVQSGLGNKESALAMMSTDKTCTKCGGSRFNSWNRCMDCRNARGKVRSQRINKNGGKHTNAEWEALLADTPRCVVCSRIWSSIPLRPDPRYKFVSTKGHKLPVYHGGTNNISNIQPECYQCNFEKNAGRLTREMNR